MEYAVNVQHSLHFYMYSIENLGCFLTSLSFYPHHFPPYTAIVDKGVGVPFFGLA